MHILKIEKWSATAYYYLVNNKLGWVSDNQQFYCFPTAEKKKKFEEYLNNALLHERSPTRE